MGGQGHFDQDGADKGGNYGEAGLPMMGILVVCTANRCRSVMAEALLARGLDVPGSAGSVRSAGLLGEGDPPPPEVISAMAGYGLDVADHRSSALHPGALADAGLVLGMAREHVRHVVVADPSAWPRAFTLKELVRRGRETGPSAPGESLAEWLARIHQGRDRLALLGDSPTDDVPDPIGGPPRAYAATAALLDDLVGRLVVLCGPLLLPGQV
jgi:protein-tyrosine phosphatase